MAGDIYVEAVADAKQLRAKATAAVERQLVEKFRPRIENYLERVLLEADGDAKQDSTDNDDILLGVDDFDQSTAPNSAPSVSDVEASLEAPDTEDDGEQAAISINQDGTVTLELDKMVVPDAQAKASELDTKDSNSDLSADDVLSSRGDNDEDVVIDGEQHESVKKLRSMLVLVEHVSDADAKIKTFVRVARTARLALNDISTKSRITTKSATSLTSLAECVKSAYACLKNTHNVPNDVKNTIISHLEATYGHVNGVLAEAIQDRVSRQLVECGRSLKHQRITTQKRRNVVQQLAELRAVVDAVTDRGNVQRSVKLRDRITKLMREAKGTKRMSRRGRMNEEDVVLKLSLPDDESANAVRSAFSGDEDDDSDSDDADDDIDALLADDEASDDESDESADDEDPPAKKDKKEKKEEAVTRAVARLFEADDPDDEESDDADSDDDTDDEDSEDGSDALERVVDVLRDVDGDVEIELVDDVGDDSMDMSGMDDDMEDMGSPDSDMDMSMDDDVIDVVDDESDSDDSDEIVEVDMAEVARAIREMDTGYHRHETPGPGDGMDSFGDADEVCEPFTDPPSVRSEARRRARRLRESVGSRPDLEQKLINALDYQETTADRQDDYGAQSEIENLMGDLENAGYTVADIHMIDQRLVQHISEARRRARRTTKNSDRHVARRSNVPMREMATRRGRLAEGVGKQQNNLLQMKLLNANRILQRNDLTPLQRKRVMRAMDEARTLGEVKALYTRLTQALDERRSTMTERRHRSAGTSSQVLTSSGIRRNFDVTLGESSEVFTESIDLDMWKRHAGILD